MASIKHPQPAITLDRPHDNATIVLSCDVEFTEFEVNAMNMLGVRYTLQCHLLDMDMLYPDYVLCREVDPHDVGVLDRFDARLFVSQRQLGDQRVLAEDIPVQVAHRRGGLEGRYFVRGGSTRNAWELLPVEGDHCIPQGTIVGAINA